MGNLYQFSFPDKLRLPIHAMMYIFIYGQTSNT